MPQISIIIPTLNEEALLPGILKQIANYAKMNKTKIEIIIADGGSTDNTYTISKEYSDTIFIDYDEKQTIAKARNSGARFAAGDILVFLNADIRIENIDTFFEEIHWFAEQQNYTAMTCPITVFPEEETNSDKRIHTLLNRYFHSLNTIGMGMGRGECQIIKKDVFWDVNGNNETLTAGEDFDLFTRLRKKGKILFNKKIRIYESPRRYRKIGYGKVILSWFKNSSSIVLCKKSISKKWEAIR